MSQLSDLCQHVQVWPATGQCRACGRVTGPKPDPAKVILQCRDCGQAIHRVTWTCHVCVGLQLYSHDSMQAALACPTYATADRSVCGRHITPIGVRP